MLEKIGGASSNFLGGLYPVTSIVLGEKIFFFFWGGGMAPEEQCSSALDRDDLYSIYMYVYFVYICT